MVVFTGDLLDSHAAQVTFVPEAVVIELAIEVAAFELDPDLEEVDELDPDLEEVEELDEVVLLEVIPEVELEEPELVDEDEDEVVEVLRGSQSTVSWNSVATSSFLASLK